MSLSSGISFTAASAGTGDFVFGKARPSFLTPAQALSLGTGTLVNGRYYSYLAVDNLASPLQREWGRAFFVQSTTTFQRSTLGGVDNGALVQAGARVNFATPPIVALTVLGEDLPGGPVGGNTPIVNNALSIEYFIDGTLGSDLNPGTAALPWKTIPFACSYLNVTNQDFFGLGGIVTVNIANGTYVGFSTATEGMNNAGLFAAGQQVTFQGNVADPTKVVIQDAINPDGSIGVPCFISVGSNLVFESLTFKPTAAQNGRGNPFVQFNNFTVTTFDNCRFDATATTGMAGVFDLGFTNICIVSGNTFIDGAIGTLNHPGNYAVFSMQTSLTFGASASGSNFFLGANYGLLKWFSTVVSGSFAGPKGVLQSCTFENGQGGGPSVLPGTGTLLMTPDVAFLDISVSPAVPYNPDQVTTTVGNLGNSSVVPNIKGLRAVVTDGTSGLAWGATVTGGGGNSTQYMVWYNGTNWTVMGK